MSERVLSREEFVDELCDFILALPPVEGVNPLAYVLLGQLELGGVREWMKDFWAFGVTAVQRIAGQLAHTSGDRRTFQAVAQAFSTEAGYYLTANHMDIWAEFCAEAGISQHELDEYEPIPETLMCIYTQAYYMIHGSAEESIAVFHLGVPPKIASQVSAGITMGGMGVIRSAGSMQMTGSGESFNLGQMLEAVLEREYGVRAHAGSRFFSEISRTTSTLRPFGTVSASTSVTKPYWYSRLASSSIVRVAVVIGGPPRRACQDWRGECPLH